MGARRNAAKRAGKRAAAEELRIASDIHRTILAKDRRRQVMNLRVPGAYYGAPTPDEVEKRQLAYVNGKGTAVVITPENAAKVSRYATGRPAKRHTGSISADSSPRLIAVVPTGDESRRRRDIKASDVYHRNAITPTRLPKPQTGPKVREWAAGA
jgi:hypothetical protein